MREVKLEYYVLNTDINKNKVELYNIFNNIRVYESTISEVKKYLRAPGKYKHVKYGLGNEKTELYGYEAFVEELRSIVMWQEWSRTEYEITVGPWPPSQAEMDDFVKIDCYDQFEPNKEIVADYVIKQYKQYLKDKKVS